MPELLDHRIFAALANKMDFAARHTAPDIHYFSVCPALTRGDITYLVSIWYKLNCESFSITHHKMKGMGLIAFQFSQIPVSTFQFLKWLKCLRQNIEADRIEIRRSLQAYESTALAFLDGLIVNVMDAIIDSLPDYDIAKWSEY
jgi:hypothetical protein